MGVGICLAGLPRAVQWSPFLENRLLVATSQRPAHTPAYGIVYLLDFQDDNELEIDTQIQLNVGCSAVSWFDSFYFRRPLSHREDSVFALGCQDGGIRLMDLRNRDTVTREFQLPHPCVRLDWDRVTLDWILACEESNQLHAFSVEQDGDSPVYSYSCEGTVHDASWNFHSSHAFQSVDRSGFVSEWDMRQTKPSSKHQLAFLENGKLSSTCGMSVDRNPFREHVVAVGGFDQTICILDSRFPRGCISRIVDAHASLITSVRWNPHSEKLLSSTSTDRCIRIWDVSEGFQTLSEKETLFNQADIPSGTFGADISEYKSQKVEDWITTCDWCIHDVGTIAFGCYDHLVKSYSIRED